MNDLWQQGWLVLLGTALLLFVGIFVAQEFGLTRPVTIHFVAPFQYNAHGLDADNLNDEYFTLRNLHENTVDMSGWTVTNKEGVTFIFPEV